MAFASTFVNQYVQHTGGIVLQKYTWDGATATTGNITLQTSSQPEIAEVLEATATNAEGGTGSETVILEYPFIILNNFQNANIVIGQADFAGQLANQGGAVDDNTINQPFGKVLHHNDYFYMADTANNRVLGLLRYE